MRRLLFAFIVSALAACDSRGDGASHDALQAKAPPADIPKIRLVDAFPDLEFERPVSIVTPPDGTKRLFVVEQDGRVSWFRTDPAPKSAEPFLDISKKVFRGHNEEGLLSLAFHPKFKENGYVFVWYSTRKPHGHVLSRFKVPKPETGAADPASETVFITIDKIYGNHNGATAVSGAAAQVSSVLSYPNPSTGGATNLSYTIAGTGVTALDVNYTIPDPDAIVTLKIFTISGRKVWEKSLSGVNNVSAGTHIVSWDGKTAGGLELAAGTYTLNVKVASNGQTSSKDFVVIMLK